MPTVAESVAAIEDMINDAGIGPASVSDIDAPGGVTAVVVEMDVHNDRKSRNLLQWLDFLDVVDATVGKFNASDTTARLNVRGFSPSGGAMVIVAAYDERTERAAVDLINTKLHARPQDVAGLVRQLAAMEGHTAPSGGR